MEINVTLQSAMLLTELNNVFKYTDVEGKIHIITNNNKLSDSTKPNNQFKAMSFYYKDNENNVYIQHKSIFEEEPTNKYTLLGTLEDEADRLLVKTGR